MLGKSISHSPSFGNISKFKEDIFMQHEELKPDKEKKTEWQSLAIEIAARLKAAEKAKNVAIVTMGIAIVIITIWLTHINLQNDREWRELFDSYDFISQDGGGFNNINSGEQGDLNNGTESEVKEK